MPIMQAQRSTRRADIARLTIAPVFIIVGLAHLTKPQLLIPVIPHAIPNPQALVLMTGIAEIAGAMGLFYPRTRTLAGIMLALYAVCVYPANINHAVHDLSTGTGLGWAYHYPRLFAQPFICWWALVAGGLRRG
jgi:uncharacterized membrane protein